MKTKKIEAYIYSKVKKAKLILVFSLLLPLFFININDHHDWGDDFAQYIQQTINIVNGVEQGQSNYVFNNENQYFGPPTYTVGFPVLLAPVYFLFGNSIIAFSYYITLILVLTMILVFKLLNNYYQFTIALISTLLFAYNPWILRFKGEILSELPFTLFLILSIYLYIRTLKSNSLRSNYVLMGLSIGYCMLIKGIGIVLLFAILSDRLLFLFKTKKLNIKKAELFNWCLSLASAIGIYLLFSELLFPIKINTYGFFYDLLYFEDMANTLLQTSKYYILVFQNFFPPENGYWTFASLITKSFLLTFFLLGLFLKSLKDPGIKEIITIIYLFIIFSFPNTTQGFRYLLPIFPIMLFHILYGISSIKLSKGLHRKLFFIIIVISIGYQYKGDLYSVVDNKEVINGPQHPKSIELFKYIEEETKPNSRFVFARPKALGLYCSRKSYSNNLEGDYRSTYKELKALGYDYLLVTSDIKNLPLNKYISRHENELEKVFFNEKFTLYGVKKGL